MSKKLTFSVTLTFESAINDDNDILEIASNIARAIKSEGQNPSNNFKVVTSGKKWEQKTLSNLKQIKFIN